MFANVLWNVILSTYFLHAEQTNSILILIINRKINQPNKNKWKKYVKKKQFCQRIMDDLNDFCSNKSRIRHGERIIKKILRASNKSFNIKIEISLKI